MNTIKLSPLRAVRTEQGIVLDMVKYHLKKLVKGEVKTDGGNVSLLEKFKLHYEYNESYPAIKKALKQRTIKVSKRGRNGQKRRAKD